MNSLCTKQPLNKGHLCIKAKTLFPMQESHQIKVYKNNLRVLPGCVDEFEGIVMHTEVSSNMRKLQNEKGVHQLTFTVVHELGNDIAHA